MDVDIRHQRSGNSLEVLAGNLRDARPAFDAIADDLLRQVDRRFDLNGPRWPELDPATVQRKARDHQDPRRMRASGDLQRFLTQRAAAEAGGFLTVTDDEVRLGIPGGRSDGFYGRFLVDRFPLFGVTRSLRDRIAYRFHRYLLGED